MTETLLRELLEWALNACHQGAGKAFMEDNVWHGFLSTWEDAEELLPRVAASLGLSIVRVETPRTGVLAHLPPYVEAELRCLSNG